MKPRKPLSVISILMAFLVLTSSVGVTQVSHICKLALSGIEKKSCAEEPTDDHSCCRAETEESNNSDEDPCCSNEVKVFSQEVISTVPGLGKSLPFDAAEISLIAYPILIVDEFVEMSGSIPPLLSSRFSETEIIILKCTLLI